MRQDLDIELELQLEVEDSGSYLDALLNTLYAISFYHFGLIIAEKETGAEDGAALVALLYKFSAVQTTLGTQGLEVVFSLEVDLFNGADDEQQTSQLLLR